MTDSEPVVYRIPLTLDENALGQLESVLTCDERTRAARFVPPEPRRNFIGCRAALRYLLAERLGCQPQHIKLDVGQWGKPFVRSCGTSPDRNSLVDNLPLQFNVSHSGDWGLIAISPTAIGVDIESTRPRIHVRSLARMVLSPNEENMWNTLTMEEHIGQILRLWVCKEAILKALGLGIAECLQQVSFPIPIASEGAFNPTHIDPAVQMQLEESLDCRRTSWVDANAWKIAPILVATNYFAAVAYLSTSPPIQLADFDWPKGIL